ncbi:LOW QUALITY PROTEIN: hypothetical protein U9M48_022862 [Paspalum notatum var. saurae]|uniref:Transposase n=1 Tax=Paspalum notatum var. saurae TaxID=547442 RepID=A0AAQ3TMR6_PASNO
MERACRREALGLPPQFRAITGHKYHSPPPSRVARLFSLGLMDMEENRRQLYVQAAALITALYAFLLSRLRLQERSQPVLAYGPLSKMDEQRQHNLNLIYNCNDVECGKNLLRDTIYCCVEEQVAMFLHIVGHNQRFRVIHQNWRRSIETVSRHFQEVLYAIGELRGDMIRAPSSETPLKIMKCSRWYPYFKDCVGAIDGTHIYARIPQKMQASFRGRNHYTTQNMIAAVDFDFKFTYVLAGWEGSAHDATILADALERSDGLRVEQVLPSRCWICMSPWLPSPYRGTRYHLKEYSYPTNPRELFNLRHSNLRVTVERAFGALKNRFRILDNKPFHPFKTQVKLVLACCILHNWILGHGMKSFLYRLLGFPMSMCLTPMELLWMTMQHGLILGMNRLIPCGLIGVIHTPRYIMTWLRSLLCLSIWMRSMLLLLDCSKASRKASKLGQQHAQQQQQRGPMRWTSALSSFALRRMCQMISTGVRTDKGFKEVHLNQVAKALQEYSGQDVIGTQVYNHLRKWRQRWVRVSKLRELSGTLWDDENFVISLEEEHYKGHIKVHPKDAEYLNKPIENY